VNKIINFLTANRIILALRILNTHTNSGVFDAIWYKSKYGIGGINPLLHFAIIGIHQGKYPNSRFDRTSYMVMNPDIALNKVDPLIDYLFKGWWEKKSISPADHLQSMLAKVIIPEQKKTQNNEKYNPESLDILWVIPDFRPGLGGHMVIFRMVSYLESKGHRVSIAINDPTHHRTSSEVLASINKSFFPFKGRITLINNELPELKGDAVIATDRFSCYIVQKMSGFRRKLYFVLDHETEFYPMGTEALISENTYSMGFDCLSCGEWLHRKMTHNYGAWSCKWNLAHDPNIYFPAATESRTHTTNRVCFYARHSTPRRAVELGFKAFEILAMRGVVFEVDMLGCDLGNIDLPYKYKSYPLLDAAALATLYQEAAIGMVFSATNHSIMNKEMMACGLPVIDLDVESVRAEFPEGVLKRTMPHPVAIADALEELLYDSFKRVALSKLGTNFANQFCWEDSGRIIEKAICERVTKTVAGSIPSNA
jgi:glycosyltransferase involved in cell wall biosynthesis